MIRRLLFGNFRFVYSFSRKLRSRFTSTGLMILAAIIMAGVFGFDTRQTLSFQIFSILLSVLFVSMFCSLFFRNRFDIQRVLPEYASVGQPVNYSLRITNNGSHEQIELSIQDELETHIPTFTDFSQNIDPLDKQRNWFDRFVGYPRLMNMIQHRRGGLIQSIEHINVDKHSSNTVIASILPVKRGYLNFNQIRLMKPDPFGLINSIHLYQRTDRLLVFPRHFNIGQLTLPGSRKYQPQGNTRNNTTGDSEEFHSLREYRPGDPLKKIHWKSVARFNRPVIKEFHDDYSVRQGLILDNYNNTGNSSVFEDAVSIVTSFAISCLHHETMLDLMFAGDQPYRFNAGNGSLNIKHLLEILACVNSSHKDNLPELENLAINSIHECSVYICTLLAWDERRQGLIKKLIQNGITVYCLVVSDNSSQESLDTSAMLHQAENLFVVRQGALQEDLHKISTLLGQRA